jgi:gliding motility associated protien GldN
MYFQHHSERSVYADPDKTIGMTGKRKPRTVKIILREFSSGLKLLLFLIALFFVSRSNAQCSMCVTQDTGTSILIPGTGGRKPVPYPFVREADVMWSKRIWRTIDLREKLNHPYFYPETPHNGLSSLFDVIRCGVLNGCITAFDNPAMDDEFKMKMSAEAVANLLVEIDSMDVEDPNNPGTFTRVEQRTEINSPDVLAYWVKEDWFFDKQRSVMDVRILGLCPMATKKDPSTGAVMGFKPLFWVYFPQLRPLLVRQRVFLGKNFSMPTTYDDLFHERYFSSYIHKESNVFDRTINSYYSGLDVLLEGEKIKESISNFEHDLWHL